MGIFDPKVDANIAYEQPQQAVASPLGGIAQWIGGGIAQARQASGGPTAGERKDALELAQTQGLQNSLLKAEALRREGRVDEANRAEQTVLANAARDGMDLSSGSVKALYRATTGRDPEFMGVSQEERMAEAAMKTPEFQGAFIATYASGKDMTEEERVNTSFVQMARTAANEQMLNNNSIEWDQGRSQAFSGHISDFNVSTLGQLQLAASQGAVVGIDTINQAEVAWQAKKGQLIASRPQGITDAQWKPVQDQMAQTDKAFATLLEISSVEGSRGLTARTMQPIAAALMADKDLDAKQKYAAINALPKLVELGVVSPSEVYGTLQAVKVPDISASVFSEGEAGGFTNPTTGETSLFPTELLDSVKGLDPVDALSQAKAITKVTGQSSPDMIASSPKDRDDFTMLTSKSFAAMTTISKDRNEFASAKTVNEVFDGKVVAGIDAVAKTDPAKARVLFLQGEEALNQQHAIASTALMNTVREDSVLTWNEETQTLDVDYNSLTKFGMTEDNLLNLRDAADRFYGGDFLTMMNDRGSRMQASEEYRDARQLLRAGYLDSARGEARELVTLAGTVQALNEKRKIFSDKAEGLVVDKPSKTTPNTMLSTPIADRMDELSAIRGFEAVSEDSEFLNAVGSTSGRLGIDAGDLLKAISFETVGTFSPSIKNPNGSATGLIQFIEKTAKGLGTSTAALKGMTRVEQMKYVEKYLAPYKGRMKNLGDVYMAIHWPAGVGKSDDYVMYREGSKEYAANKNLDKSGDGVVTRGETLARLRESTSGKGGQQYQQPVTTSELPETNTGPTAPQLGSAPEGLSTQDAAQVASLGGSTGGAGTAVQADEELQGTSTPEKPSSPSKDELGASVAKQQDDAAMAKLMDEKLSGQQKRQLKALGIRPAEVDYFETEAEAKAALEAGEVEAGTIYLDRNGNIRQL